MNIDNIREERAKWLEWKNIVPMREALKNIQTINTDNLDISYGDWLTVGDKSNISDEQLTLLEENAKAMIPWVWDLFCHRANVIRNNSESNFLYTKPQ